MERLRSRAPILGVYTLCTLALASVAGCGGGGSASSASAQNATSSPPPAAAVPVSGSANLVTQTIDVPSAGATGHTVQGLTAGTWYFTVTAYTNVGTRSAASDVASKSIS
jgi:hypothetical protein